MEKLKKLAEDYVVSPFIDYSALDDSVLNAIERAYIDGFLKAREMAVDILGQQLDPTTSIYEVLKLGEKEV